MNMSEKAIKAINLLLAIAISGYFNGLMVFLDNKLTEEPEPVYHCTIWEFATPVPRVRWWESKPEARQEPNMYILEEGLLRNDWMNIIVTYETIETEYLGRYYITAYCPEECGWSWATSSGATCHYSDDPTVPTTCAIDRRLHNYGEYLMVDGKIYVTEDTGPGVQGAWIDTFVETMDEVNSFSSHYTGVYSVKYIKHKKSARTMFKMFDASKLIA